jgi:hypothetical protein
MILDLESQGADPAALAPRLRALPSPPRLLAFASHIRSQTLQAAREAGCDEVLTRGQFYAQLSEIMRQR